VTRQEQRLVEALVALRRAVSSLDIAIDYDHREELHPDALAAIRRSLGSFGWCEQLLQEAELDA
jgi:hypothetical protein